MSDGENVRRSIGVARLTQQGFFLEMFLILKIKYDKVCYIINTLFLDERENLNFNVLERQPFNVCGKCRSKS